ncbi:VOC family protein [Actinoplanes sp. N902-109]|uniref:VOC family protein n=1 Tax=Actinoplanes sp. (strain N902-109) TaxID=649831 RepID=UPI0003295DA4|nr:VOC family protein [Actinoplanes sp. N902-109]AGL14268.1 pterin-4-alpha-carbinolamine dehydratase [Actinoplanes sp. N902-109]
MNPTEDADRPLSRGAASSAVGDLGWRYLLGTLRTAFPVRSLTEAADLAARAITACGSYADDHLRLDLRYDRVVLTLQSLTQATVTARDTELAKRISASLPGRAVTPHAVQTVEIGIDALDIPAIRPFWKAVLGYIDDAGALVDPAGQGPAVWFQPMDKPRPQRNRIHFDICVPHDAAPARLSAALAAGGRLLSAERAPAFWVLADPEGNEACITTWQGRD